MAFGKVLYETYAEQMNGYDAGFRFEGLRPEAQERWNAIATAVITAERALHVCDGTAEFPCMNCP